MKIIRQEIRFIGILLITLLVFSGCSKKIATIEDSSPSLFTGETKGVAEADNGVKNSGGDVVVTEPLALLDSRNEEKAMEPKDISNGRPGLTESSRGVEKTILKGDLRDVFFEFNIATLKEGDIEILKKNAEWLRKNRASLIRIEGYADERGTSEYNLALGEKRAQTAKKYLMALGIIPSRVDIISYGKEKGFCAQHNEECWAQNRRGHFVVVER